MAKFIVIDDPPAGWEPVYTEVHSNTGLCAIKKGKLLSNVMMSAVDTDDFAPGVHTHVWADITSTPTTLLGYGITDAAPLSHTHVWSDITGEPTTLAGYGITDAVTDTELTAHEADTTNVHGIADTANLSLVGHTHAPATITAGSDAQVLTTVAGVAAWADPTGGGGGGLSQAQVLTRGLGA